MQVVLWSKLPRSFRATRDAKFGPRADGAAVFCTLCQAYRRHSLFSYLYLNVESRLRSRPCPTQPEPGVSEVWPPSPSVPATPAWHASSWDIQGLKPAACAASNRPPPDWWSSAVLIDQIHPRFPQHPTLSHISTTWKFTTSLSADDQVSYRFRNSSLFTTGPPILFISWP